jgi:hypothetical protein
MSEPMEGSGYTPDELRAKFPAITNPHPMNPVASTQVQAILRAEEFIRHVWPDENDTRAALFDPAWCPPMAKRAERAAQEYRDAEAYDLVTFDTGDTEYQRDELAEHGVVRVWQVGSRSVLVLRDRWRSATSRVRQSKPVEFFGGEVGHDRAMWQNHADVYEGTGLACNVRIAKACAGPTRMLPVNRGTLVLLFRCCRGCEDLAGKIADNTHQTNIKIAEMETRLDGGPPS